MDNTIRTIRGFRYYIPNPNDLIYRRMIKHNRHWENAIVKKLYDMVIPNSCVIDCGCHVGTHTMRYSKKAFAVFAFEPTVSTYNILKRNLALNGIKNVRTYNMGLAEKACHLKQDMAKCDSNNSGSISYLIDNTGNTKANSLDNILLDEPLIKKHGLSLIKIDVEEMEINVLRGAVKLIEKYKPVLYVERMHNKKRIKSNDNDIVDFMNAYGYKQDTWHEIFVKG